ncbi:hypothetical protein PMAYCL1PPCAC_14337, partial [Pristionchus mayeri]
LSFALVISRNEAYRIPNLNILLRTPASPVNLHECRFSEAAVRIEPEDEGVLLRGQRLHSQRVAQHGLAGAWVSADLDRLQRDQHRLEQRIEMILTNGQSKWASQPDECVEAGLDGKTHLP